MNSKVNCEFLMPTFYQIILAFSRENVYSDGQIRVMASIRLCVRCIFWFIYLFSSECISDIKNSNNVENIVGHNTLKRGWTLTT